jgi:murein DD-endopeptidase MepM/ murein hydrolase activator NlpD
MTRVRRPRALAELFLPWTIAALMLTLAWFTFQLQPAVSPPVAVRQPPPSQSPATMPRPAMPAAPAAAQPPATVLMDADVVELRRRNLPIPVAGVLATSLVPTFHEARGGGSREHEALDILAPRGTPAVAVEESRVEKLFTSERGGLTVYLFDPSGQYCYYYAHLDRYADDLKEGDVVPRGHIVGYVGTTGNAPPETPHLHFAVFKLGPEKHWWEGTPIDPYAIWR